MVCVRDATEFYGEIREHAKGTGSNTLHIFVAGTYVDSLVSLKILADLLKDDSIFYSVFPVYGYDDVREHVEKGMQDESQPYVAVFINCGATKDLVDICNAGSSAVFFVLDSHRPVELANIRSRQVYIAWTDDDQEKDPEIIELAELPEDSGDETDDDDDDDDRDDVVEGINGRKRKREDGSQERKHRKEEYRQRGTYYGRPAGCSMYEAAHFLRKESNFHLWLACVALTDHFVHFRMPQEKYQAGCIELEQKVISAGNQDKPRSTTLEGGVVIRLPDDCRIEYDEELFLMCLPRWNLFNSMEFSTYPCTSLKTWSEPGQKRLRLFFAEMGIKHQLARQKYTYMDSDIKSRLKENLKKIAPKYGLEGISFRSFHLYHGYKTHISAANLVYGLTALLESTNVSERRADNFWTAASALHLKGWKEVERGMDLAIKVQEAIVRVGRSVINKKILIKSTGGRGGRTKVQTIFLENNIDLTLLAHPLALTRLIHFIKDAQKNQGERSTPMVAAAIAPGSKKALIVGVMYKPVIQDQIGNIFGSAFERAAELLGVGAKLDLFESSSFQLEREHVDNFFLQLKRILNDYSIR